MARMKIEETILPGAFVIVPRVFRDDRGYFYESYQTESYHGLGIAAGFVQDNHSRSVKGVLRGLHFQRERPQAQLVYVSQGAIFDVIVDLRAGSPSFGRWCSVMLSGDEPKQLYMPPGFAHGFYTLSDTADVHYKVSEYYHPDVEGGIRWDDPSLGIEWPDRTPIVGANDLNWPLLSELSKEQLPQTTGGRDE